ncbi:MAG: RRXRR domain-containing protein [Acidobacteriales bacterium]|nr:RRXRR domain-containing protein [Terriglobales bacterium]
MPCHAARARELLRSQKAVRRFDRGLFYIKLVDRADGYTQPVAAGIDPGSKKEGFTVKSAAHTYLNIQADAVTWVKEAEKVSTQMRRARRYRKTPYREMRGNRNQGQFRLPPSTRARWGWKLRIVQWVCRYYPITAFVVEDIQAVTKPGKGRWNKSFSPLEVGKQWFYAELRNLAHVELLQGYETAQERNRLGLRKESAKLSDSFDAHCVDSFVLANVWVGGHTTPDNTAMLYLVPLRFHRRQLHRLQPQKGGVRKPYGGTLSQSFKRGSWVKHLKWGVCYVGGAQKGRVSLHDLQTGRRLTQNAKPEDCTFLTLSSWRIRKEVSASPPR